MKIEVKFTVDVGWLYETKDTLPQICVEDAVEEAIYNAISYAEGQGHVHVMDEDIYILLDGKITTKHVED